MLVDTNVIIHFPSVFQGLKDIHIHLGTVEELDRLKESENPELAYRARKGAKLIKHNLNRITIVQERYREQEVDDMLLMTAKKQNMVLVTNDLTLELKARFNNVQTMPYTNGDSSIYTGIKRIGVESECDVDKYLVDNCFLISLYENEIVVFEDKNSLQESHDGSMIPTPICAFIKKTGELQEIKEFKIKNYFEKEIKARNIEQKCLLHVLNDKNIKIIVVNGGYGTGKTYLTVNYALDQLEQGKIDKIVYVPNNAITEHSRQVAAVPGGLLEKELLYMGSLIDILGYEMIEDRVMNGTLEVMPISLARGRNIERSIILVNEAQNLTEEHIKLLIGRVGEETTIIFDGDIHQTDRPVFRNSNGLKLLYKVRKSEFADLFATVKLEAIERSRTAQVSSYLDTID